LSCRKSRIGPCGGFDPSEAEKDAAHRVKDGKVGTLVILDSFAPTVGTKNERKKK
jgi:hypothetical protein